MLSEDQISELRHFLNRLQGKEVRVEFSSRLNMGFRVSYACTVEADNDNYSFASLNGDVSVFVNPFEAEAFSSDTSSISLLYGAELVTIRHARSR